jgi:hypothetical protein
MQKYLQDTYFICTFAAELRTLAALAVNSVSPERACGALKSLCFSIFLLKSLQVSKTLLTFALK